MKRNSSLPASRKRWPLLIVEELGGRTRYTHDKENAATLDELLAEGGNNE